MFDIISDFSESIEKKSLCLLQIHVRLNRTYFVFKCTGEFNLALQQTKEKTILPVSNTNSVKRFISNAILLTLYNIFAVTNHFMIRPFHYISSSMH